MPSNLPDWAKTTDLSKITDGASVLGAELRAGVTRLSQPALDELAKLQPQRSAVRALETSRRRLGELNRRRVELELELAELGRAIETETQTQERLFAESVQGNDQ